MGRYNKIRAFPTGCLSTMSQTSVFGILPAFGDNLFDS